MIKNIFYTPTQRVYFPNTRDSFSKATEYSSTIAKVSALVVALILTPYTLLKDSAHFLSSQFKKPDSNTDRFFSILNSAKLKASSFAKEHKSTIVKVTIATSLIVGIAYAYPSISKLFNSNVATSNPANPTQAKPASSPSSDAVNNPTAPTVQTKEKPLKPQLNENETNIVALKLNDLSSENIYHNSLQYYNFIKSSCENIKTKLEQSLNDPNPIKANLHYQISNLKLYIRDAVGYIIPSRKNIENELIEINSKNAAIPNAEDITKNLTGKIKSMGTLIEKINGISNYLQNIGQTKAAKEIILNC